jgi:hypothetical protein
MLLRNRVHGMGAPGLAGCDVGASPQVVIRADAARRMLYAGRAPATLRYSGGLRRVGWNDVGSFLQSSRRDICCRGGRPRFV